MFWALAVGSAYPKRSSAAYRLLILFYVLATGAVAFFSIVAFGWKCLIIAAFAMWMGGVIGMLEGIMFDAALVRTIREENETLRTLLDMSEV